LRAGAAACGAVPRARRCDRFRSDEPAPSRSKASIAALSSFHCGIDAWSSLETMRGCARCREHSSRFSSDDTAYAVAPSGPYSGPTNMQARASSQRSSHARATAGSRHPTRTVAAINRAFRTATISAFRIRPRSRPAVPSCAILSQRCRAAQTHEWRDLRQRDELIHTVDY
jgi:hypothetical protein